MSNFASKIKLLSRFARLMGYLTGALLLVLLWLALIGFPDFLTRWILAGANGGDYYIEAQAVYLDLGGGLSARNVCVYRKGIPGPPLLESRNCRILFHLLARPRAGRSRIKEVRVVDGVFRPLWNSASLGINRSSNFTHAATQRKPGAHFLSEVDLDVSLHNFDILGVWVDQIKTSVRVDATGVFLSRLAGKVGRELHSGSLAGTVDWRRNGQVSGRLATSFDPRALIPVCKLFYPEAIGVLDRFSFPSTPPRMDFTFESDPRTDFAVTVKGRIQASNYAYEGAVIGFANMNAEYVFGRGTNWMKVDPFSLTIGGRHARGAVEFDFRTGMADFRANSEVNLAAVVRLLGLKEFLMEPWMFEEGTHIMAEGRIGLSHPEHSKVEARVEGYKIGYKGITVSDYSFNYHNLGFKHTFSNFRGNLGGGSVSGSAMMLADKSGTNWTAAVQTEIINADTDDLLKLVHTNLSWHIGGKIFGNFELSGIGADLAGEGRLTVRGARIFKSPLGTGLLAKWGATSRDFDLTDMPADGRFTFKLDHRNISSRDLFVEFGSVGVAAQGHCGLDGSLEWMLKPVLLKENSSWGRAVVAFLSSRRPGEHLLTGTVEKPEWRPIPK